MAVKDLIGNFITSNPIYGRKTGAVRILESHTITAQHLVKVRVTPEPETADANSNYLYTTSIAEYPYADRTVPSFDDTVLTSDETDITTG
jgi:hypothetical protein